MTPDERAHLKALAEAALDAEAALYSYPEHHSMFDGGEYERLTLAARRARAALAVVLALLADAERGLCYDELDPRLDIADPVGIQQRIAADVWPDGARLACLTCGMLVRIPATQAGAYLKYGWPTHCGATMRLTG